MLFFSNLVYASIISNDQIKSVSNSNEWKALLHYYYSGSDITDPQYFSDRLHLSLENELRNSVAEIYEKNNIDYLCKFPARYFFIKTKFNLEEKKLDNCRDLIEFEYKSPITKISLIYAAENISMPTSMMGHVFLKLDGINSKGIEVSHAISFFTDVDKVDFVNLVIKSLATGMQGVYALNPYEEQKNGYLFRENRNVWEYSLALTDYQKKLIQYHLYELKNVNFKYLFHYFNCATLVNNVLSVAEPSLYVKRSLWVTPLDVVKNARPIIESSNVTTTSKWKIGAILESENFSDDEISLITEKKYSEITESNFEKKHKQMLLFLAGSVSDFEFENNKNTIDDWRKEKTQIKTALDAIGPNAVLEVSNFKIPAKTIQDSQIYLAFEKRNNNIQKIGFLPASHQLIDNTINYRNESELKLGNIEVDFDNKKKKFFLDKFILYGATSFLPDFSLLDNWSLKVNLGYDNLQSKKLLEEHAWSFNFGFGKTKRLNPDIDFTVLLNTDLQLNKANTFSVGPSVNLIIREIFDMKSIIEYRNSLIGREKFSKVNTFSLEQAKYWENYSFNLNVKRDESETISKNTYQFLIKKFF